MENCQHKELVRMRSNWKFIDFFDGIARMIQQFWTRVRKFLKKLLIH